ncbi:arabinan endo-1,5-alpha-L-arabinosidase [Catalinimonas alkaloidigena]|nr:arabinan endo-1,5-alpha-L-arabinosidase [Catalinimonas alkaloidigena]
MKPTYFLKGCLLWLGVATALHAQPPPPQPGDKVPVHDPVMIRQDDTYYLFCTGRGIAVWSSPDLEHWKAEAPVFPEAPTWTDPVVPEFRNHIWAPDISFHNGQYYLYYSVSAFGKNTSAIGVVTNQTLHPQDPKFKWVDHGIVVKSVPGRDLWNAIDPNLMLDEDGTPWLTFGSFWSGIKLVQLQPDLLKPAESEVWYTLASRPRDAGLDVRDPGNGAIEAPFLFRKDGHYYLFVSTDYCCRGENSTYKMVVGRSDTLTGPYVDRDGKPLIAGGGTLVMEGNQDWYGVGHNSVYTFDGTDYLVFHGYDAADKGRSKLRIYPLSWSADGWPELKKKPLAPVVAGSE